MKARSGLVQLRLAATVGLSVCMFSGCGDPTDSDVDAVMGTRDGATGVAQPLDAEAFVPGSPADAGGADGDAGGAGATPRKDGGTTGLDAAVDAGGAKDAAVDKTPDAGPTAQQDGGNLGGGDGGKSDATTPEPSDVCALVRYPTADDDYDAPTLEVNGGVTIRGIGCKQMWEGIVMTVGGRGLCTAAFISDRHLISASHCYARDGAVSLQVKAPTWDNGMTHTFQAMVKRSGANQSLDISVIDLGKSVEWATPERRFVLHAGKAGPVDLHLYGFGDGGSSGGAGTLRGVPNRATIRVTDNGRGNLTGKAGPAQLCTGDSGGPAFVEKTAPVLYGINQAIVPSGTGGGRTCASTDWSIMFTNVSAYVSFVEQAIGTPCTRKQVDGLDVAQCW